MKPRPRRYEPSAESPPVCGLLLQTQTLTLASDNSRHSGPACPPLGFLTVKQVAARLAISYNSVLAAIRNGALPAYRFGPRRGTYRIDPNDLVAYVSASRTVQAHSSPTKSRKTASTFQKLDGQRLLNAWREQGVAPEPHEEASG